uniref:Carboxypeptidase n=1 Tax=Panagrolaimus davidi TaxID=227884 RepID=A0A914QAT6_9BILA
MQNFVVALILASFFAVSFVIGARTKDDIKQLPGVNFKLNFKHYSGYFQVSKTHFLHYWFVESQNDPVNDPLIFWYNGGPGCSSVEGIIHEMGPYLVNPDGKTLRKNPNSWNNFASVVYIEAPAGVGYSYSSDGNITTSDDLTAEENYEGLKQFFKKYPNFQNHSTFIIGESYAGIYVPTLTTKIIENQNDFPINLSGIAIGNGLLNYTLNQETQLKFLYSHGFIDEISWEKFEKTCCNNCVDTCDLDNLSDNCIESIMVDLSVNPYNIYGTCDSDKKANLREAIFNRNLLMMTKSENGVKGLIPCFNDTDITTYMNQKNVRKALHIPVTLPEWNICIPFQYEYQKQYTDMTPFFEKIYAAKVPILEI